jgi:hypothetical protein
MLTKSKSLRRDYPAVFGLVVILLGIFIIGGIAYTYTNRPAKLLDEAVHVLQDHG